MAFDSTMSRRAGRLWLRVIEGLDRIYDAAFFREWGRNNELYVACARQVGQALLEDLKPRRLVDFGTGCGVYADFFRSHGVETVALDGVACPPRDSFLGQVELRDFTVPFLNMWGPFDLAVCLEVAEHILERDCGTFLDNLVQFAPVVALSAAPPNQGGKHHVNEQPKRYWRERLAARGFKYDRPSTGLLVRRFTRDKLAHMWMGVHISIYRR